MVVASTISISDKLSPCAAGPLLGPFMRPNRLEASLAHVFGPAAPPSEGFPEDRLRGAHFQRRQPHPAQVRGLWHH